MTTRDRLAGLGICFTLLYCLIIAATLRYSVHSLQLLIIGLLIIWMALLAGAWAATVKDR